VVSSGLVTQFTQNTRGNDRYRNKVCTNSFSVGCHTKLKPFAYSDESETSDHRVTLAALTAVKRHRMKPEIVYLYDNRCSKSLLAITLVTSSETYEHNSYMNLSKKKKLSL
jgi:hypothetical protein